MIGCLLGCSDSGVPKKLIPQKQMENILWDMTLADQFAMQYLKKDSAVHSFKDSVTRLYDEVFAIHHITKDEFKESFQYYTNHPEITKVMFDTLFARGNRMRTEVYKHPVRPPTKTLIAK
jgi:hypothetical protein